MLKNQTILLGAAFALTLAAAGCSKKNNDTNNAKADVAATTTAPTFNKVEGNEFNTWIKDHKAVAVDANSDETRTTVGFVPGAILLSSSAEFQASELPEDKNAKLVFYCGNEACGASEVAAAKAAALGYTDVNVYKGGIKGWVDAGYSTEKLPTSAVAPAAAPKN